jgi:predicted phage terminase large subunit-like protein
MILYDFELIEQYAIRKARMSFWHYRLLINPTMIKGWWQKEIADELQAFYVRLKKGERPILVIEAPPQFGKSSQIVDFITWLIGQDPDSKTIYTSFSNRLGVRANARVQRVLESKIYAKIFPQRKVKRQKTQDIIELPNGTGYFRNTTVLGSITGETLDLGVIDDPIKGREAASSENTRTKTWDWFTNDFFTRFSEKAGFIVIATRWHLEDPTGRIIKTFTNARHLSYPAIAEKDEKNRKTGESLFPEHKSVAFLIERKKTLSEIGWLSLYQQNPVLESGHIIKTDNFGYYAQPPKIKYRAIFADTAQKTKEHNDYTVLLCAGLGDDGKLYILDLARRKVEAPELLILAKTFWAKHKAQNIQAFGVLREMVVEDAASGTGLIQTIKKESKIPIRALTRQKDKFSRLLDVLPMISSGYVMLDENAPWVSDFINECAAFSADDTHDFDDQVDVLIDAISAILCKNDSLKNWANFL